MTESPLITIVLATYNGEHHIKEQLDSIIGQSYTHWRLLIRDDGSTDGTVELIKNYSYRYPNITFTINTGKEHGAVFNFGALFQMAKKDLESIYLMFCDQDDIWLPDKIAASIQKMQETELDSPNLPVLVYGNLQMVTEQGHIIDQQIKLLPDLHFTSTLIQNFAFGCTMMLNKSLIQLIKRIPPEAENHDYWVALVTAAFGKVGFLNEPLIHYRQHEQNVTSQGADIGSRSKRFTSGFNAQVAGYKKHMVMLEQFNTDYSELLTLQQRKTLTNLLHGYRAGRLQMLYQIFKNKIFKLTPLQNIGMLYIIIFFYPKFKPLTS